MQMDVIGDIKESVKVVVRCRPMHKREIDAGHENCVSIDESKGCVEVKSLKNGLKGDSTVYFFDSAFGPCSTQKDLYEKSFRDIVQSVLLGFNGTIFAYGQTGTGKTFTIQGEKGGPEVRGLMPNSLYHIFDYINGSKSTQFLVRASYLEIYKEEIRDILRKDQKKRLEIKEKPDRGVYVRDLSTVLTRNIKEIEEVMNIGQNNRSVGATSMNERSSRSHAIFVVTVESCEVDAVGQSHIRVGKLNLVDLAGSERQNKTNAEGERFKEATKINLGLSTLGNVISALCDENCLHVPYRDSKLTRLLQDSLGGNSKTVMVANIGPSSYNYDETINTLRYASRAKNIKNTPKINEEPKDALLREYRDEIQRLKQLLISRTRPPMRSTSGSLVDGTDADESDMNEDDFTAAREAYLRGRHESFVMEKERIVNDHNMVAEEKTHLLKELKLKESRLNEELAETAELEAKLQSLESKLLGSDNSGAKTELSAVEARTRTQKETLERHRRRLAAHQRHEDRIRACVSAESANVAILQEGFTSLSHEVDTYTAKMKKLFGRIQKIKQDMKNLQDEHIIERQKQEQLQGQIMRDMKLRQLILANFVPHDEQIRSRERTFFDEQTGTWRFNTASSATQKDFIASTTIPSFSLGLRRPAGHLRRLPLGKNILCLGLDPLPRTTLDYEPPELAPQVVAALKAALQDDEVLELDASPTIFRINRVAVKKKDKKLKASQCRVNVARFPESRGLVPK